MITLLLSNIVKQVNIKGLSSDHNSIMFRDGLRSYLILLYYSNELVMYKWNDPALVNSDSIVSRESLDLKNPDMIKNTSTAIKRSCEFLRKGL